MTNEDIKPDAEDNDLYALTKHGTDLAFKLLHGALPSEIDEDFIGACVLLTGMEAKLRGALSRIDEAPIPENEAARYLIELLEKTKELKKLYSEAMHISGELDKPTK